MKFSLIIATHNQRDALEKALAGVSPQKVRPDEIYAGRGRGADSDRGRRLYNPGRQRKFVYGRAFVYHLDHPIMPRPHFAENKKRFLEVVRPGKIARRRRAIVFAVFMKIHIAAGRAGSPLPAARPDGCGAHGVTRPTNRKN